MNRYIFEESDIKYNFDYEFLISIEKKIKCGITYEEAIYLLRWVVSMIKQNLNTIDETYTGYCGFASNIGAKILKRLGIKYYLFNMKNLLNENYNVHSLVLARLKVLEKNNVENKSFIIDPTFKQFCIRERCQKNRILKHEDIVYKVALYPGYFLSLSEDGTKLGYSLINEGFFEFNEHNFKLYCDAFQLYKNEQNYCFPTYNIRTGKEYIHEIEKCKERIYMKNNNLDLRIPSQINNDKIMVKK